MTEHEIDLARAIGACTYLPATPQKLFAKNMAFLADHCPERELTLRQRHYMELLAWRMRRQMPKHLIPDSEPLDLPRQRKKPKRQKADANG
jgi:hypothetical protein